MFKSEQVEKIHIVTAPMQLEAAEAEGFRNQSKAWGLMQVEVHVLDLKSTRRISKEFYQALIQFKSNLRASQKSLYTVNVEKSIIAQFKADGVEQVFSPVENIDEAKKRSGIVQKARANIDVEFINPFLTATKKTLEVQANTPLKPLRPFLKKEPNNNIAIAGVISLISDKFNGSITLCFPIEVFLKIYENMFGEKHTKITKELEDAAGELLNIIYGQAKIELNSKAGYDLKKALPTVMTGEKINISQQGRVPTVVLPFETDAGTFHIEIESEKN